MDSMAIFAVFFLIVMFASLYAYSCATLNDGKDPILEVAAKKIIDVIDSHNEKKKDI